MLACKFHPNKQHEIMLVISNVIPTFLKVSKSIRVRHNSIPNKLQLDDIYRVKVLYFYELELEIHC